MKSTLCLLFVLSSPLFASTPNDPPTDQTDHYTTNKVISLRNGSVYRQLGFKAGDVIKTVNGEAISDPKKLSEILSKMDKPGPYIIHIERDGRDETLEYEVRE